jgi:hypothetical protein
MASAGGRPSWQAMVSVKNFHRSARALPAARRHAGHIIRCYDSAGHSLISGLCRVPAAHALHPGGRLAITLRANDHRDHVIVLIATP